MNANVSPAAGFSGGRTETCQSLLLGLSLTYPNVADSARSRESNDGNARMTADAVIAVLQLLEANGVEVHVDGGWAVDALLGH